MQRVTQSMLNTQLLRNLNNNLQSMDRMQNQLATGRKINKPSDDPVGISYSMRYRSELSANDQYEKNVDSANSWIDFTDTILSQTGDVINRVRELVVQGANGSNSQDALNSIKSEIEQLYNHMVRIGNSEFNGKYVFNGQKTNVPPYTEEAASIESTDDVNIYFEISPGVKMPVTAIGSDIFGKPGESDNIFGVLQDVITALGNGDIQAVGDSLGKIDSRNNKFLEVRADIGARSNRLEHASNRIQDISVNLQELRSKVEDADIAEVVTNLKMSESVYQASLSVGSKLISPTLVDFLR